MRAQAKTELSNASMTIERNLLRRAPKNERTSKVKKGCRHKAMWKSTQ